MPILWVGAQTTSELTPLRVWEPITRTLSGASPHQFSLELTEPALIEVENKGRATILSVRKAGEAVLLRAANWRSSEGRYRASLQAAGSYLIEVAPDEPVATPGDYRVAVLPWPSNARDAQAEIAMTAGMDALLQHYFGQQDLRSDALNHFQAAIDGFDAAGNFGRLADARFEAAGIHFNMGEHAAAEELYSAAGDIWSTLGDQAGLATVAMQRGLIAWRTNRLDIASTYFAEAASQRLALDDSYFYAQALNNLGLVHRDLGDARSAGGLFRQALEIWQGGVDLTTLDLSTADFASIEPAPWLADSLIALGNLAWAEELRGELLESERLYQQARGLSRFLGRGRFEYEMLFNIARVRFRIGDLDAAIRNLEAARDYFNGPAADEILAGHTHHGLADVYRAAGDFERARIEVEAALQLRTPDRDPLSRAASLLLKSELALDSGDRDGLTAVLDEVESLSLDGYPGRQQQALGRLLQARLAIDEGLDDAAPRHFGDAIELYTEIGDLRGAAAARIERANLLMQRGEFASASGDLDAAGRVASQAEDDLLTVRVMTADAALQLYRGRASSAREAATAAIEKGQAIASQLTDSTLRRYFSTVQRGAIDVAVHASLEDGDVEQAWSIVEAYRRRSQAAPTREQYFLQADGNTGEWNALRASLTYRREALSRLLMENPNAEDVAVIRAELADVVADIDRVQSSLVASQSIVPKRQRIDDVVLADDELALVYHSSQFGIVRWIIRNGSIEHRILDNVADIARNTERVYLATSQRQPLPTDALESLSSALIGDIADWVTITTVAVMPDGILHYVPFAALIDPSSRSGEPLIARRSVAHTYSLSALAGGGNELADVASVAIIADPIFAADDVRVTSHSRDAANAISRPVAGLSRAPLGRYVRLPGTLAESQALTKSAGARETFVATGGEATRELVVSGQLQDYDLLHFGTHGVLDDAAPAMSGLVLSAWSSDGEPQPSFLRAQDIALLTFDAHLVVLSACDTGAGRISRGDGLDSLGRAFLASGARTVISTTWAIPDRPTSRLMSSFYQEFLEAGTLPAKALQRAQNQLRGDSRWQHPYYWASFKLQGAWR